MFSHKNCGANFKTLTGKNGNRSQILEVTVPQTSNIIITAYGNWREVSPPIRQNNYIFS